MSRTEAPERLDTAPTTAFKDSSVELLPEEQVTLNTYDHLASTWSSHHGDRGYWALAMHRLKELLPGGAILEIGSGRGRDAIELVEMGYQYTGVDLSSGFLSIARRALPDLEFYQQSVYRLSFPTRAKFDGFWCTATLLHCPKSRIDTALQSIREVVRRGGVGFISLKEGDGEQLKIEKCGDSDLKRFFSFWTQEEFAEVLDRNGYELIEYSIHPDTKPTNRWIGFFVRIR